MTFNRADGGLQDEYNALMKRCQCGPMPDPEEIWELCRQLLEAGYPFQADRLGEYLPD